MSLSAPPPPRWTFLPLPRRARAEPLARAWLAAQLGHDAITLPLSRTGRGRPQLGPPLDDADCSWSHSGEGLLVALGHRLRVGVDLEWLRPRPRAGELARRFFDPREADWLAARPPSTRTDAFIRLWCAKEAVLKAHGRGLSFGLDRLHIVIDDDGEPRLAGCDPALGAPADWQLRQLRPAPGYLGALAWRRPPAAPAA
ncbi:4'-phosphopantetheinyl transferase family protein [Novilysobacter arseniciresistens]|uniref:4'-phosphopantetheinyl transferase family protein n=1 Tax=Novilysobacter arseniciresistens TaxID=1385522 RepID=UPI00068C83FA|nr:4'-phosphopantetheinyl transferase superfamily protein [Lysobacter arseniciresistens]